MAKENFKYAKEFWSLCGMWTIGKQEHVATMVSILFAILATIGVFGGILAIVEKNAYWILTLIPVGILYIFVAPIVIWKKERLKVQEYEKVALELVVENSAQYIHQRGDMG